MNRDGHYIEMKDPEGRYTLMQFYGLLVEAQKCGHPLSSGSYIEKLTVSQLDALLHGKSDA